MHLARDLALLAVLAACGSSTPPPSSAPTPSALRDETKHTTQMIEVAKGVALEVIDYGGTGEPIVFLAGLGNTGHVFDDFAPALTDRHRVLSITRRGFGVSGTSQAGHDVPTRVADDLGVLDALKVPRAIFAGHSIAGDGSELALTHPDRVSALIYLDASQDHIAVGKLLETAPNLDPVPPPEAMASISAFAANFVRQYGVAMPTGEYVASLDVGPRGEIRGFKGDPKAGEAIVAGTRSFDLAKITTRSLVFLATEATIESFAKRVDVKLHAKLEAWWPKAVAFDQASRLDARSNFKAARVVELPKAHHYVFISDRARVLEEIRTFTAK